MSSIGSLAVLSCNQAFIPGFSASSALSTSRRSCSVRVAASTPGSRVHLRMVSVLSGRAGTVSVNCEASFTSQAMDSGIAAVIHTGSIP